MQQKNLIVICNDHYQLLKEIIDNNTNHNVLIEGINNVNNHDNIKKVLNKKQLWYMVDPDKVSLEFLNKHLEKFRYTKISNRTLINLLEKYKENTTKFCWKFKFYYDDIDRYELIETLIKYNFINWKSVAWNFFMNEKFIEKHINDLPMDIISRKYKFLSEEFLLKYGHKIIWPQGKRKNIPQKVFEKYYNIIKNVYDGQFILNEENFEKYSTIKKFGKWNFITVCDFNMLKKLILRRVKFKFSRIVLSSAEEYDKLLNDKNFEKYINELNFELFREYKECKISEKFIDYIIKNGSPDQIYGIIRSQPISEKYLEKNIDYFKNNMKSMGKLLTFYIVKYQTLTEKFIKKNLDLDENMYEYVLKYQKNFSPEFFQGYNKKTNFYLINHNYDDDTKINLIANNYYSEKLILSMLDYDKNAKINLIFNKRNPKKLILCDINYTEKIINYLINTEIVYCCDIEKKIVILTDIISKKILHKNMLINIDRTMEEIYGAYDCTSFLYLRLNYVLNMFTVQINIPDMLIKKFSLFIKKFDREIQEKIYNIIRGNKELYIDKNAGKLLKISPNLKLLIREIKKFMDLKIDFF